MSHDTENSIPRPVIKAIGIGGGGGNAVNQMARKGVDNVELCCVNTDAQALGAMQCKTLQIGAKVTRGLGAGSNPDIGRQSALEDSDQMAKLLSGADMLFLAVGMGGGTGTGAAPVIAEVAREQRILTVAVATRPFIFEVGQRQKVAADGLERLRPLVDSLIVVSNDKLFDVAGADVNLSNAFEMVNDVVFGAVKGIADIVTHPGIMNIDFADVKTVMSEQGIARMGMCRARGEKRAREATEQAIHSPLLEGANLKGARGVLVNLTTANTLGLGDMKVVGDIISAVASPSATVKIGTAIDMSLDEDLQVTVIATGLEKEGERAARVADTGYLDVPNYRDLERPTVERLSRVPDRPQENRDELEYAKVPSLLRKNIS